MYEIMENLREKLAGRGVRGIISLGRAFRVILTILSNFY